MVDTKVSLSGLILDNPVIPASGTFGFGQEYKDFYDINILGSISIKGTTVDYRFGNDTPRIAECTSGLINSVGLQNPGVDKVVSEELPNLAKIYKKKIIANISGFSIEEYIECAKKMDVVENVGIIEVNVSCPNVHNGGMAYGVSAQSVSEVTKAVKDVTKKPVYIKLSPNVTDIVDIAKACESSGADGLSLINTLLGMRIDIRRRAPVIANKMGGFSGPAIFPMSSCKCSKNTCNRNGWSKQRSRCYRDDDGWCFSSSGRICKSCQPFCMQGDNRRTATNYGRTWNKKFKRNYWNSKIILIKERL